MSRVPAPKKPNRREEILSHLAHMLESQPGVRLTTAKLAAAVGVSEAALYRHFPSKARMFEALITFAEENHFRAYHPHSEQYGQPSGAQPANHNPYPNFL